MEKKKCPGRESYLLAHVLSTTSAGSTKGTSLSVCFSAKRCQASATVAQIVEVTGLATIIEQASRSRMANSYHSL